MKKDCIDKCTGVMTSRRMNDHIFWLINDQHIIIFVENIERNVFGENVRQHLNRKKDGDTFSPADRHAGFDSPLKGGIQQFDIAVLVYLFYI